MTRAQPIPGFPSGFKPKADKAPQQHLPRRPLPPENRVPRLFLTRQSTSTLGPPSGPLRPYSKPLRLGLHPGCKLRCRRRLQGDLYRMPLLSPLEAETQPIPSMPRPLGETDLEPPPVTRLRPCSLQLRIRLCSSYPKSPRPYPLCCPFTPLPKRLDPPNWHSERQGRG